MLSEHCQLKKLICGFIHWRQLLLVMLLLFAFCGCSQAEGERWRREAGKLVRALPNLNRSQKEAVAKAIFRRFTLWQVSSH